MMPAFLSWGTLFGLIILSYFFPVLVAYFLLAFDVYWLLLVLYLGIHLVASYQKLQENIKIDWQKELVELKTASDRPHWQDIYHLLVLPTVNESIEILKSCFDSLIKDGYPTDKLIVVLALEGRAGESAIERAETIKKLYGHKFKEFIYTIHPDGIVGELKGKGANQAWAAKQVKKEIIDPKNIKNKFIMAITTIIF